MGKWSVEGDANDKSLEGLSEKIKKAPDRGCRSGAEEGIER
jgi:hypothetical protein